MTHVEDIHAGDWVLLVRRSCKACGDDHEEHVGVPYQVLAIELPFFLLRWPDGAAVGLDTREWQVKRVGSRRSPGRYVTEWVRANCGGDDEEGEPERGDGHMRCVKCGERLRQVQIKREWRWRCPSDGCGYDGGPVEASR